MTQDAAERELADLRGAVTSPALEGMTIWGLNSWSSVLGIAVQAASGDIALKRGETAKAIAIFEQGVALEDQLIYDEPPTWHLSVRLQLADALRKAGRDSDARKVRAEDQKRHPNNVWSR